MDVPKERSGQEIRKYLDLRVNDLKLRAVDGLSVGMARLFSLMVILMLAAIVLAAFAFGTLFLLGDIIGSMAAAAFIIGGVFLIVRLTVLMVWKKFFVDIFVKLFIGILYKNE